MYKRMLSLIYCIGFILSMYLYSLGDRCFYFKRYKHHKLYNDLDYKAMFLFCLIWFVNVKKLFQKEFFYFTWKVPIYNKKLVEKYVS